MIRTVQIHPCQELFEDDGNLLQALVVFDVVFDQLRARQTLVSLLVDVEQQSVRDVSSVGLLVLRRGVALLRGVHVVIEGDVNLQELLIVRYLLFVL